MGKDDVYRLLCGIGEWVEIADISNRLHISYRAAWSSVQHLKDSNDIEFKQNGKKKMVKVIVNGQCCSTNSSCQSHHAGL